MVLMPLGTHTLKFYFGQNLIDKCYPIKLSININEVSLSPRKYCYPLLMTISDQHHGLLSDIGTFVF